MKRSHGVLLVVGGEGLLGVAEQQLGLGVQRGWAGAPLRPPEAGYAGVARGPRP
ncbi:MAG: hypothetical protein ACRYFX_00665 [Janthinobacterium lividum]